MVCPISYYVIIRDETRTHNDLLAFERLSFSSKLGGFQPEHLFDYSMKGRVWITRPFVLPIWEFPGGTRDNRRFAENAMRHRSQSATSPNQPRDVAWLCRCTGNGRSSRCGYRRSTGGRSRGSRVLLELQARSPIPATRRFGADGSASHLGAAFCAHRHAYEIFVSTVGANGACHVNGRWSEAHCLVLSFGFLAKSHACAYSRTLSTFSDSEASMLLSVLASNPSLLKLMV